MWANILCLVVYKNSILSTSNAAFVCYTTYIMSLFRAWRRLVPKKGWVKQRSLAMLFLVFVAGGSLVAPLTPAANAFNANDAQTRMIDSEQNNGCDVSYLSWLICNPSRIFGSLADGLFAILEHLLRVEPMTRQSEGGEALYQIWSAFRSVANVVFIILILMVIWSHVTGVGISNYNIKRILPRLIVSVILINSSYYIGLLIVDLSNVLGNSIKAVLDSVAASIPVSDAFNGVGNVIALILGGVVSLVLIFMFASSLLPLLISAITILLTVVLILVARQVVIIALIIISPIAFALNTLPNTQKWFSKWWSTLFTAAMVYPTIALLAGGGGVAANIIRSGAGDSYTSAALILAMLAIAAEIMPLILIPKFVRSSTGMLAGIANAASKISKGAMSPAQEHSNLRADRRRYEKGIKNLNRKGPIGTLARGNARYAAYKRKLENELKPGSATTGATVYDKFEAANAESIGAGAAKDIKDVKRRERRANEVKNMIEGRILQLDIADVEAAEAVIKHNNLSTSDLQNIISDPNANRNMQNAALRQIGKTGDADIIGDAMEKVEQLNQDQDEKSAQFMRRMLADGVNSSNASEHSTHLGSETMREYYEGSHRTGHSTGNVADNLRVHAASRGRYTPQRLSSESAGNIARLDSLSNQGHLTAAAQQNLQKGKAKIQGSGTLRSNMGGKAKRALDGATFSGPVQQSAPQA